MTKSVGRQQSEKQSVGEQRAGKPKAAKTKTAVPETVAVDFTADSNDYVNRELSQLELNYRVLSEVGDETLSLFKRLKFLSITTLNLDEFYVVRVASLKGMVHAKYTKPDIADLTPQEQLDQISEKTHQLVDMQYSTCNRFLLPTFKANGLRVITEHEGLSEDEAAFADECFKKNAYPVLTPMVFNSSRPFPLICNKALNIAALPREKKAEQTEGELEFAMVQIPSVIPRIVELPRGVDEDGKEQRVAILLERIIGRNMPTLLLSYGVMISHLFRTTRNAGLTIDEEEAVDLLGEAQRQLKRRQRGGAIRLEIEDNVDRRFLKILKEELSISNQDIFGVNGPLDLTFLMKMYGLDSFEHFKAPRYVPQPVPALTNDDDIFTDIRKGDILLHHPYQGSDPVAGFVRSAAKDPEILAIKQTLYHVNGNSSIIAALVEAMNNGKQVSVLMGLKVRFDGENNISWTKMLKRAGCHMIYGLVGLKTRSKITLVVRVEDKGIQRYVHPSAGDYDDSTAKLYTDCGILICGPQIGEDATAVFNMLLGYSEPLAWNKLSMAPLWLRARFLRTIRRETDHAREGRPAHIMAKMNSLCDKGIMTALYETSCAGVKIEMIIRGICCLKADVPGSSENMSVRSIVGNLLEHNRIFYFLNDGSPEVYMGSADWMPRSLDHHMEIMFPVENEELRENVIHILELELEDNIKAHILQPDGTYGKGNKRDKVPVNSQEQLCQEAMATAKTSMEEEDPTRARVFKPIESSGVQQNREDGLHLQGLRILDCRDFALR